LLMCGWVGKTLRGKHAEVQREKRRGEGGEGEMRDTEAELQQPAVWRAGNRAERKKMRRKRSNVGEASRTQETSR
jgi:hypothetical protein